MTMLKFLILVAAVLQVLDAIPLCSDLGLKMSFQQQRAAAIMAASKDISFQDQSAAIMEDGDGFGIEDALRSFIEEVVGMKAEKSNCRASGDVWYICSGHLECCSNYCGPYCLQYNGVVYKICMDNISE